MARAFFSIILLIITISVAFPKNWRVNIKLINDTKDDVTVYVKRSDQVNSGEGVILLIKLKVDEVKDTFVIVKQYSVLSSYGILSKGGKTEVSTLLINEDKLSFSPELTLPKNIDDNNKPSLTDFTTSTKLLEYDPKLFLNKSTNPKPIEELFDQYLGGLAICVHINGKDSMIDKVEPHELGTEMEPYTNGIFDKKELFFTNETDQEVKASVPGIIKADIKFDVKKMYHIKIVYNGLGEIGWMNKDDVPINTKFVKNLSNETHYKLAKYKIKYKDSLRVYQINKAYCFEGIFYQVNELTQIGENHSLDGSVYFFNEGNYTYKNQSDLERTFGREYIGYWADNSNSFTELLDFSLNVYYNQQRSIITSLPKKEIESTYSVIFTNDTSIKFNLTYKQIVDDLSSKLNSFKKDHPEYNNNELLGRYPITISKDIDKLDEIEINKMYDMLNQKVNYLLPVGASVELKKNYIALMQPESKDIIQ